MTLRRFFVIAALALSCAVAVQPAPADAPVRPGRIAYISEPAHTAAFVESVQPAGGGARRLSGKLPHGSFGPSFAPDGKRLALTILKGNVRHVQILSGGKLRDLARGRAPAWSPDGRWIAFLSGQKVGSGIFLIHLDGTGLHAIGPRHLELGASTPAWSPDGRTLVYTRQAQGRSVLWTIGSDGTRARPLVTARFATQPAFSPDGRHVTFIGFDPKGRMGIWVVNADGRAAHPLYVVPGQRTLFNNPVYSPDGRSIAFVLKGSWAQIAVMRATGGGQRIVSPRTRFISGLDWAPA